MRSYASIHVFSWPLSTRSGIFLVRLTSLIPHLTQSISLEAVEHLYLLLMLRYSYLLMLLLQEKSMLGLFFRTTTGKHLSVYIRQSPEPTRSTKQSSSKFSSTRSMVCQTIVNSKLRETFTSGPLMTLLMLVWRVFISAST